MAFLDSVAEYNEYGIAVTSPKYRVDDEQALQLYGMKVAWFATLVWCFCPLLNGSLVIALSDAQHFQCLVNSVLLDASAVSQNILRCI